jgi:hypothetical protein
LGFSLKRFLEHLVESDYRKTLLKKAESSASELEKEAQNRLLTIIPQEEENGVDMSAIVVPGVLLQSEIDQEGYPTGEILTKMNDPGVIEYSHKVQKNMDDLLGVTERNAQKAIRFQKLLKQNFKHSLNKQDQDKV